MDWVKRNLFFVIGTAVALILLAAAGYYTWTGLQKNNEKYEALNQSYADLKVLIENPMISRPGSGVDNSKLAAEQQQQIREFLKKAGSRYQHISPIPEGEKISRDEFASSLRLTLDQLQREATNSGVMLPAKYNFSFDAQRQIVEFKNIHQVANQLGEVKAICDVLNRAKVNFIEIIRRERVSTDDDNGPPANYLSTKSQTNDMAVLSPYEVTFRSFSPELAAVLAGFANSPNGFIVKAINVEPGPAEIAQPTGGFPVPPVPQPVPVTPRISPEQAMADRYGIGGGKGDYRPPAPQPVPTVAPAAPAKPTVFLTEKQLRVTLSLVVVKMLPPKK